MSEKEIAATLAAAAAVAGCDANSSNNKLVEYQLAKYAFVLLQYVL